MRSMTLPGLSEPPWDRTPRSKARVCFQRGPACASAALRRRSSRVLSATRNLSPRPSVLLGFDLQTLQNLEQLDLEDQGGFGGDLGRRSAGSVAEVRRNDETPLATGLHPHHADFPTGDDTAGAELKLQRLPPLQGAVERRAVHERADVVDADRVSFLCGAARALDEVGLLERRQRLAELCIGSGSLVLGVGGRRGLRTRVAADDERERGQEGEPYSHDRPRIYDILFRAATRGS